MTRWGFYNAIVRFFFCKPLIAQVNSLNLYNLDKISCTRCLAVSTSFESETEDCEVEGEINDPESGYEHAYSEEHEYMDCIDCQYRRQIAVLDSLPDTVVKGVFLRILKKYVC